MFKAIKKFIKGISKFISDPPDMPYKYYVNKYGNVTYKRDWRIIKQKFMLEWKKRRKL